MPEEKDNREKEEENNYGIGHEKRYLEVGRCRIK